MISESFYKQAILIRKVEDTFLELFSQGKMNGTVHTCNGQEFSAIAFSDGLIDGDVMYSNHRCHGHYIAHTQDVEGLIAELMGKKTGTCGGIGSSQHLCNKGFYSNGIQGGIVPVAAGMAMAAKKDGNNNIAIVFIGDGTLGQGVVYETFNLISLLKLPLLIICENNGYAQSTKSSANLSGDILSRAKAFGLKTFHSNTWDLESLFSQTKESIDFVRNSYKPVFHLVDTYRLNHHSKSDDHRDIDEVEEYVKKDPLNIFKNKNKDLYESLSYEVNNQISSIVKKVDMDVELTGDEYYNFKTNISSDEYIAIDHINERIVNRINSFFDQILEKDKKVLFIGEDVLSPYGGAFKVSKGLSKKYPNNVISTPISEQAITGLCNGLALGGYRPYLEIMFGDFILLALDQIINHASKFHHMYNKKVSCPIVIRTPMGGGRGYGPTHSQTLDKFLVGIDNVSVVALNSFIDPKLIYNNIYQHESHPMIVIENKIDYGKFVGTQKLVNYSIQRNKDKYPVVKCSPIVDTPTLTLVTYGGISSDLFSCLLDIFKQTDLIPELIILSLISPLNIKPVLNSVKKTRRIIVVEEGSDNFGIGAEVISEVMAECASDIILAKKIGALPVPISSAKATESYVLPNTTLVEDIVKIISEENISDCMPSYSIINKEKGISTSAFVEDKLVKESV